MSADPVWCLFRVKPSDVPNVKKTFDKAVEQSQVSEKLQEFLRKQVEEFNEFHCQDKATLNHFIPGSFVNKNKNFGVFDWNDLHKTYHLFFPHTFVKMFENLFMGDAPIISEPMDKAKLEFVITNRVGAAEILWGGLGWERASRLPGYLGNMLVLPEDVANALATVEKIFAEVAFEQFLEGARVIGVRGNANEDIVENIQSLVLSALGIVLKKGNGLLALNYPHIGSMPFPEHESNCN
ncbi:hypothetical protein [Scytonema sp. NUACC26]|uniref:hypothetical protein n=1 Tax=Scytonema sp. NUACC26 TaxID=3140176 RepID=UPI0034DC5DEB